MLDHKQLFLFNLLPAKSASAKPVRDPLRRAALTLLTGALVVGLSGCASLLSWNGAPAPVAEAARIPNGVPNDAKSATPRTQASTATRNANPSVSANANNSSATNSTRSNTGHGNPPVPPQASNPAPANQHRLAPDALFTTLAMLDTDYRRGGKSVATGFDCSGLVAHVFLQAYGIRLPHNALAQSERGQWIEEEKLDVGDLVFYNTNGKPYSHVGIYIGDGRFIHAPKPGAVVRTERMSLRYWSTRYNGARRMAPTVMADAS
jgi:cell wall-associated NlpC family hydrolase